MTSSWVDGVRRKGRPTRPRGQPAPSRPGRDIGSGFVNLSCERPCAADQARSPSGLPLGRKRVVGGGRRHDRSGSRRAADRENAPLDCGGATVAVCDLGGCELRGGCDGGGEDGGGLRRRQCATGRRNGAAAPVARDGEERAAARGEGGSERRARERQGLRGTRDAYPPGDGASDARRLRRWEVDGGGLDGRRRDGGAATAAWLRRRAGRRGRTRRWRRGWRRRGAARGVEEASGSGARQGRATSGCVTPHGRRWRLMDSGGAMAAAATGAAARGRRGLRDREWRKEGERGERGRDKAPRTRDELPRR